MADAIKQFDYNKYYEPTIVLLTDGIDNRSCNGEGYIQDEVVNLREKNLPVTIYTLGLPGYDIDFCKMLKALGSRHLDLSNINDISEFNGYINNLHLKKALLTYIKGAQKFYEQTEENTVKIIEELDKGSEITINDIPHILRLESKEELDKLLDSTLDEWQQQKEQIGLAGEDNMDIINDLD